jgi:glycosyltransferase involved in cell wall biosynthesis
MKFSVAIPVFGQANFISTALESISAQKCSVDVSVMDATPDDSVQLVLSNYLDLISYRRHGPDSGQSSAIQEGWDSSDGEILVWLCADDYFFPDAFEFVRQIFINHPEIDVVYGDSVFVDQKDCFLGYFPEIDANIKHIKYTNCISQPSCFIRRSAFEAIGGKLNQRLHYIMDWDLWLRLYQSGAKFKYINKPLSVVRMYDGTKTSSRSSKRTREIARQLFFNANPFASFRSLLGFYFQDVKTSPKNQFEIFLSAILKAYRDIKINKLCNDQTINLSSYGVFPKTNAVKNKVNVYLPWYRNCAPNGVKVCCDLDKSPELVLNGNPLKYLDGNYNYQIVELNLSEKILHLVLYGSKQSWNLKKVLFF